MNTVTELANVIQSKPRKSKQYVIAISGFGGSGKTTMNYATTCGAP